MSIHEYHHFILFLFYFIIKIKKNTIITKFLRSLLKYKKNKVYFLFSNLFFC